MTDTPRIIHLHLGFHKTGSTSLQELLRVNRARLGADTLCLVQYDPALRPLEAAAKRYDRRPTAGNARRLRRAWGALLEHCAREGATRVLISSENLAGRIPSIRDDAPLYATTGAMLRLMREGAGDEALDVTVYTRDGAAWLDSLARHLARTRGSDLRGTELAALPKFAEPDRQLAQAVARIVQESGLALRVLAFEDDLAHRLGPGEGWLRALGLPEAVIDGLVPVKAQNRGLAQAAIESFQAPWMRWLPRRLRAALVRRRAKRVERQRPHSVG